MSKSATLLLITGLMLSSLVMVGSAFAQSTVKPSVPEFTVRVIDHSYDVPTTTTTKTDPYDGQITTETTPGYHMVNGSIVLSIKNQPFAPYYNSEGFPVRLYYHIRAKGDSPNWNYNPSSESYFQATNSTYTTLVIGYSGNWFQTGGGFNTFRPDGTLDFQVEAFIGYMDVTVIPGMAPVIRQENLRTEYIGQTSGWSETQTVTIPNAAYTPVPPQSLPTNSNPTPTPTVTDSPTQNPTSTSTFSTSATVQLTFGGVFLVLTWEQITMALIVAAAILLVIIAVLVRKITTK
jgi:hypothetical protein